MKKYWLLLLLFPFLAGCATVIHGTTQKIPVTSEPSGANVNVDGTGNYTTPVTLELQRKIDHLLTVSKEGFKEEVIRIIHTISGAVAGNIIAGGLIGWGIDAASGAQYKLIPETVNVVLKPEGHVEKPIDEAQTKMYRDFERDNIRLEYEKLNLEKQKMGLPPVEIPQNLKQPIQTQQEKGFVVEMPKVETPIPEATVAPKEASSIQPVQSQPEKAFVIETPKVETSILEVTAVPKEESSTQSDQSHQEKSAVVETSKVESSKPEETAVSKEVSNTQPVTVQPPVQNTIVENKDVNEEKQQDQDNERRRMYKSRRR